MNNYFKIGISEASTFRERLSELITELPDLELASLQRFTGRINLLSEIHDKLNEQRRVLDRAIQHARAWQLTVNQLHDLLETIQRQGEPAKQLLTQLQEIERAIASAFETESTEAFSAKSVSTEDSSARAAGYWFGRSSGTQVHT
ncbi:MAG: hypothetical protein IPK19_15250 [Chloroflexi bacterium]|nr:hypothetical protein [Chloroflexota bacterium]